MAKVKKNKIIEYLVAEIDEGPFTSESFATQLMAEMWLEELGRLGQESFEADNSRPMTYSEFYERQDEYEVRKYEIQIKNGDRYYVRMELE